MKPVVVAVLGQPLASCASPSNSSGSGLSAAPGKNVAENNRHSNSGSAANPCRQATESQNGAAVMGAPLGAVGDYAPYSSRNGWAVRYRGANAGQRVVGTAEAVSTREIDCSF